MKNYYYLFLVIFATACSTTTRFTQVYMSPAEMEDVYSESAVSETDSLSSWEMEYIGDAFEYLIFECQIVNHDTIPLEIGYRNFSLNPVHEFNRPGVLLALNPKIKIGVLTEEKKSEKSRRKSGNILNGILVGLELIAIAATPGANVVEGVLYATDGIVGMTTENKASLDYERDLGNELNYFEEGVLYKETIFPGDTLVRDIVFPRTQRIGPVEIVGTWSNKVHKQTFDLWTEEINE